MRRCASVGLLDGCLRAVWRVLVLVNMRLVSPQRCSPAVPYCAGLPSKVRPRSWPRMAPLVEFGGTAYAISSGSSSRTRSCAPASRRLCSRPIPRCFVGGIPPSRLAGVPRQMRRAGLGALAQRASSPSKPPHPTLAIQSLFSRSIRNISRTARGVAEK